MREDGKSHSPRNPEVLLETKHLFKSWDSPARKVAIFEGAARFSI